MSKETVKKPLRPGKNGGSLNAGPGPGRPKGSVSITNELKKVLAEDGNAEKVARALVIHAVKGNAAAIKAVLDRVDGPVKLEIDANISKRVDLSRLTDDELRVLEPVIERIGTDSDD